MVFTYRSSNMIIPQTWFGNIDAGPMLIAVFITEMVILHKYVYLFILFIY